ncbi:hypothetical protein PIIN_06513 [Serendipita indica DSM 11827]|uniref:Uncharacterized protein n=1 Tax=Serendipita indica (strain DSM 11827) TaxID=1109443 RepID=G4TMN3_SERID|nr:hypothetical protein PIIN_06513 [Serendipita indica DSM 11827]
MTSVQGPTPISFGEPISESRELTRAYLWIIALGLVVPLGPPLGQNHPLPIRTLIGHPNGPFISGCFQHLPQAEAERLRTSLRGILDELWWRINQFGFAPPSVLDVFVFTGPVFTGLVYTCAFCAGTAGNSDAVIGCIRAHINV